MSEEYLDEQVAKLCRSPYKNNEDVVRAIFKELLAAQRKQILKRIEDNLDLNKPTWGDLVTDLKTGDI